MMTATKKMPPCLMAVSPSSWMVRAARQPSTEPSTQVRWRPARWLARLVRKEQRKLAMYWTRGMMARYVADTCTLSCNKTFSSSDLQTFYAKYLQTT